MLDIDKLEQYNKLSKETVDNTKEVEKTKEVENTNNNSSINVLNTNITFARIDEGNGFSIGSGLTVNRGDISPYSTDTFYSSSSKSIRNYNLIDEIDTVFKKLSYNLMDLTYNCSAFIKFKNEFILNNFNEKFADEYDLSYYKFNTFNLNNSINILKNIYTNLEIFYIDKKLSDDKICSYKLVDEVLVDYKNNIFYIHTDQIYFIQFINDFNKTDYNNKFENYQFFIYDKYKFLDKGLVQFNPFKNNSKSEKCQKCPFKAICNYYKQ